MTCPDRTDRLPAFKLDRRGLARVFGELEAEVMAAVWDLQACTVADVCGRLGDGANYKTVMTVMNRLVEKGVLVRRRASRAFTYAAAESRSSFVNRVSWHVAEGLVEEYGALAVAQFVDVLDTVDPALLRQLTALIQARTDAAAADAVDDAVDNCADGDDLEAVR
ncbi:MAG: BlaI/MecI/CopY family transcriptional regulator [Ardenticatenales bacterium]|nr:BlaI/MecI/CopY family transcriptional regulator [Ardenticatenales bacterium]